MQAGNQWGIASAYATVGAIALHKGEYDDSKKCYQDSLEVCQDIEYQLGIAKAHYGLGRVAFQTDVLDEASEHLQMSLRIYSDLGRRVEVPSVLTILGETYAALGDIGAARECAHDALEINRETKETPAACGELVGLAGLLGTLGKERQAILLLGHAMAQPALDEEDCLKAESLLSSMSAQLPDQTIEDSLRRGKTMDKNEIFLEILASQTV